MILRYFSFYVGVVWYCGKEILVGYIKDRFVFGENGWFCLG